MPAKIRAIVIDDSAFNRQTISAMMESAGDIEVVGEAGTAEAALARIPALMPDVAVLDARLPDGSGIDVGRALSKQLPVIALSGYGREQDRARSAEAGFVAHLVKPADFDTLQSLIASIQTGIKRPAAS